MPVEPLPDMPLPVVELPEAFTSPEPSERVGPAPDGRDEGVEAVPAGNVLPDVLDDEVSALAPLSEAQAPMSSPPAPTAAQSNNRFVFFMRVFLLKG